MQPLAPLGFHFAEGSANRWGIEAAGIANMRSRQFAAQVAGEHAPGRQYIAEARNDHALEIELACNIRHMQGRGAAECENRKASRIDPAAHGNEPNAFCHFRVDDPMHPFSRAHAIDREFVGDAVDRAFGGPAIEARTAAEKVVGVEEAQNEAGVGHRRFAAASAIAGGPRLGACALGSDVQYAAVVDARNRATSCTDAGDV